MIKDIGIYFATFGVFLNLFYYVPYAHIINIPGYIFYVFILGFVSIYYLIKNIKFTFSKEILIWIIFYLCINFIYIIYAGFGLKEFKYLIPVIMIIPIFFAFSLLYNLDDKNLSKTRKTIAVTIVIGVIILLYDFLLPGYFTFDENMSGRAIATYANANIAGIVLILGMILSIDIVPKKIKVYFILFVFLGILVTFSRSNIMLFLIILFLMSFQEKISRKFLLLILVVVFSIFVFLISGGFEFLSNVFEVTVTDNLMNRVIFFVDTESADVSNMSERKMVLLAALEMFADSPIFGNGFASTRLWDYRVGPHNMYAVTMAEFGLIGLLIIPLFLYFSTKKILQSPSKEYKDIGLLFIVYYSYSSIFSHNMLDQSFNMVGAIIIATLGNKKEIING